MTANNKPLAVHPGMSTLTTAKFGPGMLLQHDDLEQLGKYTRELNRLMFRSLFGCGVVCGLVVSADPKCKLVITVTDGLALDCCGDPVHVPAPQSITLDPSCDPNFPKQLWVVLCGTRKCCAPRAAMCSSDDDESPTVCTRERYAFEIRVLKERPECVCGCSKEEEEKKYPYSLIETKCKCVNPEIPCYADHYAGKCGCNCGEGSDCDCNCILLARLDNDPENRAEPWTADHRVRRFVRPVLIEDPQVQIHKRIVLEEQKAAEPAVPPAAKLGPKAKPQTKK
jgi:hypothetical protein